MRYNTILFDLDGTLSESAEGIINSLKYALGTQGMTLPEETLRRFIGPPLSVSFSKYCNLVDTEQSKTIVKTYLEHYAQKGAYENYLFPGMQELLEELKQKGCRIAVASAKLQENVDRVLDYLKISRYFDVAAGSHNETARISKQEIILYALREMHITSFSDVVMIGDSQYDMIGAKDAGLDVIGVLYGYGSPEELEEHSPVYIAKDVADLRQFLLN